VPPSDRFLGDRSTAGQLEMVPGSTTLVLKPCTPGLEHTICGVLSISDPTEPGGMIR
jgi:hypothetical protein